MPAQGRPGHDDGNILLVANYSSDVGYAWWLMESFWSAIARRFAEAGRASVLIFPAVRSISERIQNCPVKVEEHDFSDRSAPARRSLKRLIQREKIRYVYLTDRPEYDSLYLSLRRWGVRSIVLHDHTPGERTRVPPAKRLIKRAIHAPGWFSGDHYIGVSRFVYDRFVKIGCIPRNKCSFVRNGIVPIDRDPALRSYARAAFSVPEEATLVVSTGRATFYKGIDFMIRCADTLVRERRHEDLYFLHCGDGPDLPAFRKMVSERGLEHRFLFAGRREDVRQILQSCDIGMQCSRGEAFSLSILEYMSAGLAALVPDHCGNGEANRHGVSGFLYEPGNLTSALENLERLLADRDLRERMGRAASRIVREEFTIERANRELVQLLSKLW